MRIEADLAADVDRARKILAEKLGKITVEERDDGVYAQVDIGPVLREAAGPMFLELVAGVRATRTKQDLSVAIVSRVGVRMKRRIRTKAYPVACRVEPAIRLPQRTVAPEPPRVRDREHPACCGQRNAARVDLRELCRRAHRGGADIRNGPWR